MNIKLIPFVALSTLLTNVALAATEGGGEVPPPVSLPLDDAGMLAVASACLVIAIRIAQRKRSR